MDTKMFYWTRPGASNTDKTLKLAVKRAQKMKIRHIVIASSSGSTAKKLLKLNKGLSIVCITHHAGFSSPGICEMSGKSRTFLEKQGVRVYTGTHFFGTIGRAVRMKFGGLEIDELVANTLRIFGQGIKVAVEIAIMALDAGLIPYNKEIIAIGGAGKGADTAIICRPEHSNKFFSFEVREIICKPRHKK